MFIVYIAFGIASGLIAAIVTLYAGAGVLMALMAYLLGGFGGMLVGFIWAAAPNRRREAKEVATQRSWN